MQPTGVDQSELVETIGPFTAMRLGKQSARSHRVRATVALISVGTKSVTSCLPVVRSDITMSERICVTNRTTGNSSAAVDFT